MSVHYIICQDPPRRDGKAAAQHLQVKNLRPVETEQLAEVMSRRNPLSRAHCLASLINLSENLPRLLRDGCSVTISGLGTFTPKLSGKVTGKRVTDLQVSGIDFQPDERCLKVINNGIRFKHELQPRTAVTDEEVSRALAAHFSDHKTLVRSQLIQLLHISRDRAAQLLRRLTADGTLIQKGYRATTRYFLNPANAQYLPE